MNALFGWGDAGNTINKVTPGRELCDTSCVREAAPKLANFDYVRKTPDHSHANLDKGGNDYGHWNIQRIALKEYYKNHPQFAPVHCLVKEKEPFKVGEIEVPIWDFIFLKSQFGTS